MKHEVQLGTLPNEQSFRDAIHIAVTPAVAFERLAPGTHVGFCGDKFGVFSKPVGIVDPFLKSDVLKGQTFWLLLYPQTITSLRHEWTHPAFEPVAIPVSSKEESKKWLRDFADQLGFGYSEMMEDAKSYVESGYYRIQQGSDKWRDTFDEYAAEFWNHYEVVTGTTVEEKDANFYSCSC